MSESEEDRIISWNPSIESVLKAIGEEAQVYAYLHKSAQKIRTERHNRINLPVIFLSTLSGAASLSDSLFLGFQYAPVIIGMVSIFTAILQTLNSFFGYARLAESHRISALHYEIQYNDIQIELALKPAERMNAADMLKAVRTASRRLLETSPLIPQSSIRAFKSKFGKHPSINTPTIANGLKEIKVYVESPASIRFQDNPLRISPAAGQPQ